MGLAEKSYQRWVKRRNAAQRVEEFLDARERLAHGLNCPNGGLDPQDIIGVEGKMLTVSDLRILVKAVLS